MRRLREESAARPLRLVQCTRSFYLGGTEGQVVELLRGMPASYQLNVAVLEEKGPLMEEVYKLGHLPASFPLNGSFMKPNTAVQVLRMARWLRRQRVELVHVHDFYATLVAVPACKLAGCKVVVGRLDLAHWHGKARRAVLAQLTRAADHVIANADAIRLMLQREEKIPASRISVIHNGIDLQRFDARMAAPLDGPIPETGGAPVVLHVANMTHPVKRQEDLIDAIALLKNQGQMLHAFLVGDGVRRNALEQQVRKLQLEGQVHFLGHRRDIPALWRRATMGVLCSSAEGLSNAIIEGMAAGVPMVVTSVGGNPELVADGERGKVVAPHKPQALAKALGELLRSPEEAEELGRNARAFVARELTLHKLVERHDLLYRKLVDAGPPAPV